MTTSISPTHQADHDAPAAGDPAAGRDQRFAEGIRNLRAGAAAFRVDERILMVLGGVLIPLGILVILLGWWGAARSPYVFDQIPYVISGGLLGVGMVVLGGFLYFTHWLTELVKDNRRQSAAVLAALDLLEERVAALSGAGASGKVASNGAAHSGGAESGLVATARGTMAHRPDCTVVAGKKGVRPVAASDGLAPCKLCGSA